MPSARSTANFGLARSDSRKNSSFNAVLMRASLTSFRETMISFDMLLLFFRFTRLWMFVFASASSIEQLSCQLQLMYSYSLIFEGVMQKEQKYWFWYDLVHDRTIPNLGLPVSTLR